jgi:hypothetical protein
MTEKLKHEIPTEQKKGNLASFARLPNDHVYILVLLIKTTLILFLSARALEHPSISEACTTLYGYTNVTIPCLEPTAEQVAVLIAEGHRVLQIHV